MKIILGELDLKLCETNFMSDFAFFRQLRENIIRAQPLDKQQQMAQLFDMLMDGVERNLLSRNRDRYN